MGRLTVNKAPAEMNMRELAHNCCYVKDGYAQYRDFETDIDARELVRDLMLNQNIFEIDSNEMLSDEAFDETMLDNLGYGPKEIEGLIALFYRNLWAMADLHARLKTYEDAEEQGLLVKLPCKVGDVVYIAGDRFPAVIESIRIGEDNHIMIEFVEYDKCYEVTEVWAEGGFELDDIGKTVFFTQEEAETALERMNGE